MFVPCSSDIGEATRKGMNLPFFFIYVWYNEWAEKTFRSLKNSETLVYYTQSHAFRIFYQNKVIQVVVEVFFKGIHC